MSSNSKILKYTSIGLAITSGLGFAVYFLYKAKAQKEKIAQEQGQEGQVRNISKATLKKALKVLKKEQFSYISTASEMAKQVMTQSKGQLPEQQLQQLLMSHPMLEKQLDQANKRAFAKVKITDQEFLKAIKELFKDDQEIQGLFLEIQDKVKLAVSGKEIDIKCDLPESLTSEKVIEIIKEIMIANSKEFQKLFIKIEEEKGSIDINDPEVIERLNTIPVDALKNEVLQSHGLEDNEEVSGQQILQYSTRYYSEQKVEGFTQSIKKLEQQNSLVMRCLTQNPSGTYIENMFNL